VVYAVGNVLILSGSHFLKILTETDFELQILVTKDQYRIKNKIIFTSQHFRLEVQPSLYLI